MQRGLTYLLIIFGLLPFQISPKFFSFYRVSWLKGWAGHTSSTVETELLLVIEYTTYMIVTCTQSPLMSLLESWNWCFFLSPWMLKIFEEDIWFHLPNRRVPSFILSFLLFHPSLHSSPMKASIPHGSLPYLKALEPLYCAHCRGILSGFFQFSVGVGWGGKNCNTTVLVG